MLNKLKLYLGFNKKKPTRPESIVDFMNESDKKLKSEAFRKLICEGMIDSKKLNEAKSVSMKTCSTCKLCKKDYKEVANTCFYCTGLGHIFNNRFLDTLSCIHYEEKIEPLRLECECEWVQESDGDSVFYRPSAEGIFDMLHKFKGKRTRMVLEEIT